MKSQILEFVRYYTIFVDVVCSCSASSVENKYKICDGTRRNNANMGIFMRENFNKITLFLGIFTIWLACGVLTLLLSL